MGILEYLKIIKKAKRDLKANEYWNMLYPNLKELSETGNGKIQGEILEARYFIDEHVEEIEKKYLKAIEDGAQKGSPQVIQEIIECLKREKTVDESKFEQIYGKARGRIKEVYSKIKSFLNIKSNDRNDKSNDETIK